MGAVLFPRYGGQILSLRVLDLCGFVLSQTGITPADRYLSYSWPRGYKTFFMLNSVGHEILNAHKYKNIKKFSFFKAQISLEYYFSCSRMLKC